MSIFARIPAPSASGRVQRPSDSPIRLVWEGAHGADSANLSHFLVIGKIPRLCSRQVTGQRKLRGGTRTVVATATPVPAAVSRSRHRFPLLTSLAKMSKPTETERCIESLIAVFQKYSGKDGNSCQLSKTEFLTFMNTELAAFTKNQKDPGVLDRMMKKLDLNSDGQLDFQEFLNLIGGLAVACHDSFLMSSQKRF
ncbi:protein S100-A11 [Chionomys nivalis]|uniref:protein S100-A11 n=1 Tax=Chionomys nivalis TaxID=269649 RepID=UPI0025919A03|nr:protein S100-A11 [Chionomys nivalis]